MEDADEETDRRKIHDKWCDYEEYCRMAAPAGIPGAFCREKDFYLEYSHYKVGEVVAIAQKYSEIGIEPFQFCEAGWYNKMFVAADLMPHHIRITGVRVERLQDISDEDCIKEGIYKGQCGSAETHFMDAYYYKGDIQPYITPRRAFAALIDRISGNDTWDSNPYVFVYDFELVD